jgi:hypothetical protein
MSDLPPETAAAPPVPPAAEASSPSVAEGSDLPWVVMWSVLLALGVAVGASMWHEVAGQAASRSAIVLPAGDPAESDRDEWPAHLIADERVAAVSWLSPGALVELISASVPAEAWAELFSDDDAWLPWLLQVQFEDPAASPERVAEYVESMRADARYRLVLFDVDSLERDARHYRRLRHGTFVYAGLMMAAGVLALLLAPTPRRRSLDAVAGGVLAGVGILLVGLLLRRFDAPLAVGPWWRAMAAGFGLAAFLAPMLKGRLAYKLRKRGD